MGRETYHFYEPLLYRIGSPISVVQPSLDFGASPKEFRIVLHLPCKAEALRLGFGPLLDKNHF